MYYVCMYVCTNVQAYSIQSNSVMTSWKEYLVSLLKSFIITEGYNVTVNSEERAVGRFSPFL